MATVPTALHGSAHWASRMKAEIDAMVSRARAEGAPQGDVNEDEEQ